MNVVASSSNHDAPDAQAIARAGALLSIDLGAVAENYRRLREDYLTAPACGAAVKANAYGLGVARVAPVLAKAGARSFFVATLDEAIELRRVLKDLPTATVFVLNGLMRGAENDYVAHSVNPVLNSLGDIEDWSRAATTLERPLPAALHIDSGINRLGLPPEEVDRLAADPDLLKWIVPALTMSHLACADTPDHDLNTRQLANFRAALARLPRTPVSFANSSGIFLGPDYHFDLARPGIALYGGNPTPGKTNPMLQVVRLQSKILQCRSIDAPHSVGYGAAHRVSGPTRIATVAAGYADGYKRYLSNRGMVWIGERQVPVVGRVSMDLITLDVTELPEESVRPGTYVDLISPHHDIDAVADTAGTIGYEVLTSLGQRYHRLYQNDPVATAGAPAA